MIRRRTTRLSAAGIVLAAVLGACGGTASPLSGVGQRVDDVGSAAGPSAGPAASFGSPGDQLGGNGKGSNTAPNGAFKDEAKIVRTGTLAVQVKDLDKAISAGLDQVRSAGGYVGGSDQRNDGDRSVATITYRIPSDKWDTALAALRGLGKVLSEQTNAVEVTGQLVDLAARIDNLRASETALQAIARQAVKVSDVLEVQNRLFEVRGQIEQLEAQRTHLGDQASYGTLQVTYGLEIVAVTEASRGWDAANEVDRASATLIDVVQSLTSAGIWFAIVWLPILLGLGILAVIANIVIRRTGLLRRADQGPPIYPTDA